jgi:RND family efflux transporter MFP subunit
LGLAASALAVIAIFFVALGDQWGGATGSQAVAAAPPAANPGEASFEAAGFVIAKRQATVAAEVTGRVTAVPVEEGQKVRRGAVLALLDAAAARTDLSTAQVQVGASRAAVAAIAAQLANARGAHDRSQALLQQGFVTASRASADEAEMRSLEANLARARAEVEAQLLRIRRAREELSKFTIVAPFDGVIIGRNAQVGEMISPISAGGGFTRTGICTIVDMSSLELAVDVSEQNIGQISVGDRAVATLDAYRDLRMAARVSAIIPAANREKGTVTVRLALTEPDPRVLPNMSAKVLFSRQPSKTDPR